MKKEIKRIFIDVHADEVAALAILLAVVRGLFGAVVKAVAPFTINPDFSLVVWQKGTPKPEDFGDGDIAIGCLGKEFEKNEGTVFDEHGKKDFLQTCAATIVAKAFNLGDHPAINLFVRHVLREDRKRGSPDEVPSVFKTVHRFGGLVCEGREAISWALAAYWSELLACIEQAENGNQTPRTNFTWARALDEIAQRYNPSLKSNWEAGFNWNPVSWKEILDGSFESQKLCLKAGIDELNEKSGDINSGGLLQFTAERGVLVTIVNSDNPMILSACRQVFPKSGVNVVRRSNGQVTILQNQQLRIDLRGATMRLRIAEHQKRGLPNASSLEPEAPEDSPFWHGQVADTGDGNPIVVAIHNGSDLSAKGVPPTVLSDDDLTQILRWIPKANPIFKGNRRGVYESKKSAVETSATTGS